MRIAYCDDEKAQSIYLKELTGEWGKEGNTPCEISVYSSAEEMLFENTDSFTFDFILLDIELDKINGIELARQIRTVDKHVPIAFLSNSRSYVFDGYEVGAIRYLLKPLTREQLFPLLDMVRKEMQQEKQYIIIGVSGEKVKLSVDEICCVEALGHYVLMNTGSRTYEIKSNINDMLAKLGPNFIATHRSYLVNLNCLERITRTECILKGGLVVPISRNLYQSVNQAFIEFYRGGVL